MKKHGTWQMAPTLTREASMFIYASTPNSSTIPSSYASVPTVIQTLKSAVSEIHHADPHFDNIAVSSTAKKNLKALAMRASDTAWH